MKHPISKESIIVIGYTPTVFEVLSVKHGREQVCGDAQLFHVSAMQPLQLLLALGSSVGRRGILQYDGWMESSLTSLIVFKAF